MFGKRLLFSAGLVTFLAAPAMAYLPGSGFTPPNTGGQGLPIGPPVVVVPEASSIVLLSAASAAGLAGLAVKRLRKT